MNLYPAIKTTLGLFEQICNIPHCSGNEERLGNWLLEWAAEHQFEAEQDSMGNVVIRVPASSGNEQKEPIVLQAHMDMVCEKTPESLHNFQSDPISVQQDGDWLTADQTTLGADNGIGMALAMALAIDPSIQHPPLEILITVLEETGLDGASALQPGFIRGKRLLNIDSEDEGVFTIGCAGGKDTRIYLPISFKQVPAGYIPYRLGIGKLKGGHSGINIGDERGNAIIILARIFAPLVDQFPIYVTQLRGGSAHNAIPRDAEAIVMVPDSARSNIESIIAHLGTIIQEEYTFSDPQLNITLSADTGFASSEGIPTEDVKRLVDLLLGLPHGIAAHSQKITGLVETSNNLATVELTEKQVELLCSQRSSVASRLNWITQRIEAIAHLAGAVTQTGKGYPAWEANWNCALLAKSKQVYTRIFGVDPVVEVIHAGLECGIIGNIYSDMDMISFGPTIENPHSPDERVNLMTIDKVWRFMVALIEDL
jgi:dipeptidase D